MILKGDGILVWGMLFRYVEKGNRKLKSIPDSQTAGNKKTRFWYNPESRRHLSKRHQPWSFNEVFCSKGDPQSNHEITVQTCHYSCTYVNR